MYSGNEQGAYRAATWANTFVECSLRVSIDFHFIVFVLHILNWNSQVATPNRMLTAGSNKQSPWFQPQLEAGSLPPNATLQCKCQKRFLQTLVAWHCVRLKERGASKKR